MYRLQTFLSGDVSSDHGDISRPTFGLRLAVEHVDLEIYRQSRCHGESSVT